MDWEELIRLGEASEFGLEYEKSALLYAQAMDTTEGRSHGARRLASLRLKTGDPEESLRLGRLAVQANPLDYLASSSMIYAQQCLSESTPEEILQAHLDWAQTFTSELQQFPARASTSQKNGKRKLGFISPDLIQRHPVLSFLHPILDHINRDKFDIYLYSCCEFPDATTGAILKKATHPRQFSPHSLPEASAQIWQDQLDLLIDLSGHASNHALMVLATKPCQRQATYLGYPNTTGLNQIDYRLVDVWSDPPGLTDRWNTEKLIRLPQCAWCFAPLDVGKVSFIPPVENQSFITFGCFNNPTKFSNLTLHMWKVILSEVPHSRLIMKSSSFVEPEGKKRMTDKLSSLEMPIDRILLQSPLPYIDHLKFYRQIDIALDTFPYHGTTTTCEALWMGVPVITLAGSTHISRVGASLLHQVHLDELIALDSRGYIQAAVDLAQDFPRLQSYHLTLRDQLKASMLLNPLAFMKDFEKTVVEMMA